MLKIGVLALQGSVIEHIKSLNRIEDVEAVEVKTLADINSIDGIILPGGESTAIRKLLNSFDLLEPLKKRIADGMPVWGTCAGMILLAKNIVNEDLTHLGVTDISVRRNAYGGQMDSFATELNIPEVSNTPVKAVFIRAPWVEATGQNVKVLAKHNDKIIATRQNNILSTSFHPELTDDISFHKYFADMVAKSIN